jgi:hypothetical protein
MPKSIKICEVTYYSPDKGAFVKEITQDSGEIFVSKEVIQLIDTPLRKLKKGQMVQLTLKGSEPESIKPLPIS